VVRSVSTKKEKVRGVVVGDSRRDLSEGDTASAQHV